MHRRINRSLTANVLRGVLRVLVYLAAYQLVSAVVNKPALPGVDVLTSAAIQEVPQNMASHMGATLVRWFVLFVVGVFTAIPSAVVIGYSSRLYRHVSVDIDILRSLPATVLVTFVFAAFGDNVFTRTMPALYITFFTVLFYVAKHARLLDKRRMSHLRELGASSFFVLRNCVFFELLPSIMVAVRQAVSLSFLVLVSVELIVGPSGNTGLGAVLYDWQFNRQYANVLVALAGIGLTGYLMNIAALHLHRRMTPWSVVD